MISAKAINTSEKTHVFNSSIISFKLKEQENKRRN